MARVNSRSSGDDLSFYSGLDHAGPHAKNEILIEIEPRLNRGKIPDKCAAFNLNGGGSFNRRLPVQRCPHGIQCRRNALQRTRTQRRGHNFGGRSIQQKIFQLQQVEEKLAAFVVREYGKRIQDRFGALRRTLPQQNAAPRKRAQNSAEPPATILDGLKKLRVLRLQRFAIHVDSSSTGAALSHNWQSAAVCLWLRFRG